MNVTDYILIISSPFIYLFISKAIRANRVHYRLYSGDDKEYLFGEYKEWREAYDELWVHYRRDDRYWNPEQIEIHKFKGNKFIDDVTMRYSSDYDMADLPFGSQSR